MITTRDRAAYFAAAYSHNELAYQLARLENTTTMLLGVAARQNQEIAELRHHLNPPVQKEGSEPHDRS